MLADDREWTRRRLEQRLQELAEQNGGDFPQGAGIPNYLPIKDNSNMRPVEGLFRMPYLWSMPREIRKLPDEFQKLIDLVNHGKLFGLQAWIAAGKPLQFDEVMGSRRYLLDEAIRTGFHSIVEVVLRSGGWSAEDLAHSLEFARDSTLIADQNSRALEVIINRFGGPSLSASTVDFYYHGWYGCFRPRLRRNPNYPSFCSRRD